MAAYIVLKYMIEYNLNNSPKDLTFTDLIAGAYLTTHGIALANVKGLLKITGPDGVVYVNPGYVAEDFSAPDIIGATATWAKTINLPVDDDDLVLPGSYIFEYKITTNGTVKSYSASYTYAFSYEDPTISIPPWLKTSIPG